MFSALERRFEPDEKIFTSMDVRPITQERFQLLNEQQHSHLLASMRTIARDVFLEFGLGSIIRLDIRADESGSLYVLEANPKPDLKQPAVGVTSLVAVGLPELGMSYDDLILSLLGDRLDALMAHRRGAVGHILELLD